LSTIRNSDQIVVVESGTVVQTGTHDELLASGGLYSDLFETLAAGNRPSPQN
jgi:ABC-type multidrug transport system fused ATPase/permease subunit